MVWLMLMVALVGGWGWAQHASEQGLQSRFGMRVTIGADFVSNYVADQLARTNLQAEQFLTGDDISEQQLQKVSTPFAYTAVVVLDEQGRLIQIVPARSELIGTDLTPRYDHLRTAVREGVPVVSRVVTSAARGVPVVAFATPYDTPRGRRVFSGALQVQNSPLGTYLTHAAALPSSRAYLIDPDGKVVASDGPMPTTDHPLAEASSGPPPVPTAKANGTGPTPRTQSTAPRGGSWPPSRHRCCTSRPGVRACGGPLWWRCSP